MANNGTYGINKPANVNENDIDIYYHYRPTRATDSPSFSSGYQKLESNCLIKQESGGIRLSGMYDLKLPLDKFSAPGFYTIYIKPKEYKAKILDVSTLAAYPNVRGVVFKMSDIENVADSSIFNNGGLVGYRIDYLENTTTVEGDLYRLITSSNRCEPMAMNLNDSSAKGIRYRFNDASDLIFCTVSPSTAMSFKSNSLPYIGSVGSEVIIASTKFNPVCLEIEMVEHDVEDVTTMLEGSQIRNLDNGLITTFNKDGDIYYQAEYGNTVDTKTGIHSDWKNKKSSTEIINSEKDRMEQILGSF